MQFKGTTLEEVVGKDMQVFLMTDTPNLSSLPLCQAFILNEKLWIDCAPGLERKYVAPVPDHAIIARNDNSLDTGRYGVFVAASSQLGRLVRRLFELKELAIKTGIDKD